ncbi:hypothetical protein TRIUR3_28645 [Triticum urartu]|uniref:Uncharacterized protein n=1 Tax=Triticum urartu TaxID=4572 RepID=M7YN78_TRIUA|nr:hypothetical protein TRIUR3_28645 [Triticum urartu]
MAVGWRRRGERWRAEGKGGRGGGRRVRRRGEIGSGGGGGGEEIGRRGGMGEDGGGCDVSLGLGCGGDRWMDGCGMVRWMDGWMGAMSSIRGKSPDWFRKLVI